MRKTNLIVALLLGMFTTAFSNTPIELKVMTFNIRYANVGDGENIWTNRKEAVFELLNNENCDLIGTQEVLHNQFEDLNSALPQYNHVGVGREDGITKGEYAAIYYRKDRFEELESGNFWLSETPEKIGSKGWDGACERIATWARLKEVHTNKEFLFINTHLDHVGKLARKNGVQLLLDRAHEYAKGAPIVLTGDFNASPESSVIQSITKVNKRTHLVDTRQKAEVVEGTNWSFHDFDKLPTEKRELIDYIFVSKPVKVRKHTVLPMRFKGKLVSDHNPITTVFQF